MKNPMPARQPAGADVLADGPGGSLPAGVERSGRSSITRSATRAIARKIQADANTQRNTYATSEPLALIVEVTTDTAAPRCGVTPRPANRIAPITATAKALASERKKLSAPIAMPT